MKVCELSFVDIGVHRTRLIAISVHFMVTPQENVGENPANAAWLPVPRSATLLHPALK